MGITKTKKRKILKKMSLVKFNFESLNPAAFKEEDCGRHYPFSIYDKFVYLGDVVQMPGHCIVVNTTTGQIYCGYHTDNFVEISEEEC